MRTTIYILIAILFVSFSACCTDPDEKQTTEHLHEIDTSEAIDSSMVDTIVVDTGQYVDDEEETANLIEEKYGKQWDFCDCVVKNDSVNKAVETAETDADFDRVIARMEEIDQHCKTMLAMPNTTPEERQRHQRKVRKCLENAGQ